MNRQKLNTLKRVLAALVAAALLLSGCGAKEAEETGSSALFTGTEDNHTMSNSVSEEASDNPSDLPAIPINTKAEEIPYNEHYDIDLLRAHHRSVADDANIYLALEEPDLYKMPIGTDEYHPVSIENPDGLNVCHIAMDIQGKIHLLMGSSNGEKWFIFQLDENLQTDNIIDISKCFDTNRIPLWFLVDKDNTYYLQWPFERNGVILDSEGTLQYKTTPQSLGTIWIYEAAVGKDGEIYLVHGDRQEGQQIGRLDAKTCTLETPDSSLVFPSGEVLNAMAPGTDTNLVLFSPYNGVWVCDTEKGILENRVPLTELSLGSNAEFWPLVFLPEGRLLLFTQTMSNSSAIGENSAKEAEYQRLLKYIPFGR